MQSYAYFKIQLHKQRHEKSDNTSSIISNKIITRPKLVQTITNGKQQSTHLPSQDVEKTTFVQY